MYESWRLLKMEKPFRRLISAGFIGGVGSYFFNVAVLSHLLRGGGPDRRYHAGEEPNRGRKEKV